MRGPLRAAGRGAKLPEPRVSVPVTAPFEAVRRLFERIINTLSELDVRPRPSRCFTVSVGFRVRGVEFSADGSHWFLQFSTQQKCASQRKKFSRKLEPIIPNENPDGISRTRSKRIFRAFVANWNRIT